MLTDVARELVAEGRFRLWTIQRDGQPIAAHVFLAAGGDTSYWLGGYHKDWAAQHPSLVAILAAIEHAWRVGDRRLDLGGGPQPYKKRFASGEDTLAWTTLVPRGPRHWRTRLSLAPRHGYAALARHLSDETKERIRSWRG
jgi:CelD/BcsL family acetyltransferase involved in cellulose biosynthesis